MTTTEWVISIAAIGLGTSCHHPGADAVADVLSDAASDAVARALHAEVASQRTPGVQYRHFTADSTLFAWDEGLADVSRGVPVTPRTTFHGLSVTKTVTAVAILQLVDGGRLDLDAPAATYLPDFPYGGHVTVRHLLAHSAGLPNPLPLKWIHLEEERATFEPGPFFRDVMARHPEPRSGPDQRFRYSNLGYVLLGELVEHVSGLRYERYVTENVFEPIGLSPEELGFEIDPTTHATGYHRGLSPSGLLLGLLIDARKHLEPLRPGWRAFRPYHVNGAAYGGLVGTADGFVRYLRALLDPSSGLLSEASRRALFTENILSDGSPSGMTLSWFSGQLDGEPYHAHAGGGGGFYAEVRIYPRLGRGSVILFNRTGFSDRRFLDRIDRHVLGVGRRAFSATRS